MLSQYQEYCIGMGNQTPRASQEVSILQIRCLKRIAIKFLRSISQKRVSVQTVKMNSICVN